jgi:hypothetical protein
MTGLRACVSLPRPRACVRPGPKRPPIALPAPDPLRRSREGLLAGHADVLQTDVVLLHLGGRELAVQKPFTAEGLAERLREAMPHLPAA